MLKHTFLVRDWLYKLQSPLHQAAPATRSTTKGDKIPHKWWQDPPHSVPQFQNSQQNLYLGQPGTRYWSPVCEQYKQLVRCTHCTQSCSACRQQHQWTIDIFVTNLSCCFCFNWTKGKCFCMPDILLLRNSIMISKNV